MTQRPKETCIVTLFIPLCVDVESARLHLSEDYLPIRHHPDFHGEWICQSLSDLIRVQPSGRASPLAHCLGLLRRWLTVWREDVFSLWRGSMRG